MASMDLSSYCVRFSVFSSLFGIAMCMYAPMTVESGEVYAISIVGAW